jgi:hypothetical protein
MKLATAILLCAGFFAASSVRDATLFAESAAGLSLPRVSHPTPTDNVPVIVNAPHLQITLTHSGPVATPGMDVHLIADFQVAPDVHVYAPGVKDFRPLQLTIDSMPEIKSAAPSYPKSKLLFLKSINQQVPVFEGKFRVEQDVNVASSPEFISSLQPNGKIITVTGELKYQACTMKVCFLPATVQLHWELEVAPANHR